MKCHSTTDKQWYQLATQSTEGKTRVYNIVRAGGERTEMAAEVR